MNKIVKMLKTQDLGDMGIGAMIVFIAMVLVAGIAASVLVQTANRLEIQAMTTGQQTTAEVATGLSVVDIEGAVAGSKVHAMTITIKSRAGSGDIDLEQTVIEMTDGSRKVLLSYNSSRAYSFNSTVDPDGSIFGTGGWNETNEEFGILVLQDADSSVTSTTPVINRGDLVMLC
jgi:archaeal flagellin FlaB